jgi:uncharacterized membrane protein
MSNEYIGAVVILFVAILGLFGIKVGNEEITGIVTGLIALWVAFRRYQRGDITIGGLRK